MTKCKCIKETTSVEASKAAANPRKCPSEFEIFGNQSLNCRTGARISTTQEVFYGSVSLATAFFPVSQMFLTRMTHERERERVRACERERERERELE